GWTRYVIESLVLQALVCQAQADKIGALSTLQTALTLAQAHGYIRLLVEERAPLAALLAQSVEPRAQHDPLRTYAEHLLSAFPTTEGLGLRTELAQSTRSTPSHHPSTLVESLSERELEVLR